MLKVEDTGRILKSLREKQLVIYKGAPIRLSDDFSTQKLQSRRDWREIVKVIKIKDLLMGGDFTLGDEHTIQCRNDVL